ncbi:hypothetical protein D1BOALGB6SA_3221 [Olavius sp. associated proteobacterium Delta 1]|nr:hypothetical protein D1BOALGB6SA_3221 [Olavius sp. associated proteobacterium Delta 1]
MKAYQRGRSVVFRKTQACLARKVGGSATMPYRARGGLNL